MPFCILQAIFDIFLVPLYLSFPIALNFITLHK